MDDHAMRLAEALAIERLHGGDGPRRIAERIATLAISGDAAGLDRFRAIACRYQQLLARKRPSV